jgi:dihydrofolate reductase
LEAGLIDEMHVAVSPVLLGAGASLPHGIDLPAIGYRRTEYVSGGKAAHFIVAKS